MHTLPEPFCRQVPQAIGTKRGSRSRGHSSRLGRLRWSTALLLLVVISTALAACGSADTQPRPSVADFLVAEGVPPVPELDETSVDLGRQVYGQYCASCHGSELEGQPDWRERNADGSFRAPPHDVTGHTWHHSDDLLFEVISVGLDVPGTGMPTFGQQLSDEEIQAVIDYLKSNWGPDERTYQWQVTWQERRRDE